MVHTGDSEDTLWHSSSDGVLVNRPTRRVIIVDIDGVRWDSFYRHLKRVRQCGRLDGDDLPLPASAGSLRRHGARRR